MAILGRGRPIPPHILGPSTPAHPSFSGSSGNINVTSVTGAVPLYVAAAGNQSVTGATAVVFSVTEAVLAKDGIIVTTGNSNAVTPTSVTDSQGNNYLLAQNNGTNNTNAGIYYCLSAIPLGLSDTITVNFTTVTGGVNLIARGVTGGILGLDTANTPAWVTQGTASTTPASNATGVLPNGQLSLVVGVIASGNASGTPSSPGGGFAQVISEHPAGVQWLTYFDQITSANTTLTCSATIVNAIWSAGVAVFTLPPYVTTQPIETLPHQRVPQQRSRAVIGGSSQLAGGTKGSAPRYVSWMKIPPRRMAARAIWHGNAGPEPSSSISFTGSVCNVNVTAQSGNWIIIGPVSWMKVPPRRTTARTVTRSGRGSAPRYVSWMKVPPRRYSSRARLGGYGQINQPFYGSPSTLTIAAPAGTWFTQQTPSWMKVPPRRTYTRARLGTNAQVWGEEEGQAPLRTSWMKVPPRRQSARAVVGHGGVAGGVQGSAPFYISWMKVPPRRKYARAVYPTPGGIAGPQPGPGTPNTGTVWMHRTGGRAGSLAGGGAGPQLVQSAGNSAINTNSIVITLPNPTGGSPATNGANALFVGVGSFSATTTPASPSSVVLGSSTNLTQLGTTQSPGANAGKIAWYYLQNIPSGQTTITVTYASTPANCSIQAVALEFNSIPATGTISDQTLAPAGAAGATWTTGATSTTSQTNEITIGLYQGWSNGAFTPVANSPWVTPAGTEQSPTVDAQNIHFFLSYQILSSTGAVTFSGTGGSTGFWNQTWVYTFDADASSAGIAEGPIQVTGGTGITWRHSKQINRGQFRSGAGSQPTGPSVLGTACNINVTAQGGNWQIQQTTVSGRVARRTAARVRFVGSIGPNQPFYGSPSALTIAAPAGTWFTQQTPSWMRVPPRRKSARAVVSSHGLPDQPFAGSSTNVNVTAPAGTWFTQQTPSWMKVPPRRKTSRAVVVSFAYRPTPPVVSWMKIPPRRLAARARFVGGIGPNQPFYGSPANVNVTAQPGTPQTSAEIGGWVYKKPNGHRVLWKWVAGPTPLTNFIGGTGNVNVQAVAGNWQIQQTTVSGRVARRQSARARLGGYGQINQPFYGSPVNVGITSQPGTWAYQHTPSWQYMPPRRKAARGVWHGTPNVLSYSLTGSASNCNVTAPPGTASIQYGSLKPGWVYKRPNGHRAFVSSHGLGNQPFAGSAGNINVNAIAGTWFTQHTPSWQYVPPRRKTARAVVRNINGPEPKTIFNGSPSNINVVAQPGITGLIVTVTSACAVAYNILQQVETEPVAVSYDIGTIVQIGPRDIVPNAWIQPFDQTPQLPRQGSISMIDNTKGLPVTAPNWMIDSTKDIPQQPRQPAEDAKKDMPNQPVLPVEDDTSEIPQEGKTFMQGGDGDAHD